jgi:hypothetical protein
MEMEGIIWRLSRKCDRLGTGGTYSRRVVVGYVIPGHCLLQWWGFIEQKCAVYSCALLNGVDPVVF